MFLHILISTLIPSIITFMILQKKDFIEPKSFNEILSDLGLSEDT